MASKQEMNTILAVSSWQVFRFIDPEGVPSYFAILEKSH